MRLDCAFYTGPFSDLYWTGAGACAAFLTNYVCSREGLAVEKAVRLSSRTQYTVRACTGRYCLSVNSLSAALRRVVGRLDTYNLYRCSACTAASAAVSAVVCPVHPLVPFAVFAGGRAC